MGADEIRKMRVVPVKPLRQLTGKVLDCRYCCLAGILGLNTILEVHESVEDAMPEDGGRKRREAHPDAVVDLTEDEVRDVQT